MKAKLMQLLKYLIAAVCGMYTPDAVRMLNDLIN